MLSDPLLRAFFLNAPFGLALVGADRKLAHVNPALVRLLGYSAEELRDRTWDSLTHPEDTAANLSLFEELREGRRDGYVIEKRYARKDGRAVWVKVTATRAQVGEATWLMGVIEEISALIEARREREQTFTSLTSQVQALQALHAVLLVSRTGSLDALLEAIVRELPLAFATPVGVTVRAGARRIHGGPQQTAATLTTSLRTSHGEPCALELHAGGALIDDHQRAVVESLAELVHTGLERQHTRVRAQAQRERLELALGRAGMGVWEYDLSTGEVVFSEHLARMVGIEGPHRQPFAETGQRMPEADRWVVRERIAALIKAPPPASQLRVEFRLARPEGGWRPIQAVGRLLRDPTGKPTRLLAVLTDVTHTRALEDDQRQKQKLAVLARISPTVVREFDEVARALHAAALDLCEQLPDHELVNELSSATSRGVALAERLRNVSGAGKSRVELAELVRALAPMLHRVVGERITLELALGDAAVQAERDALERALLNLVVNARDATPGPGRVRIEVSMAGDEALLVVSDEGTGMAPETLARIAEPFFTTKAEGRGTGLGVPVVYEAVERAGGRVEVHSELDRGTRFTLHFPRAP